MTRSILVVCSDINNVCCAPTSVSFLVICTWFPCYFGFELDGGRGGLLPFIVALFACNMVEFFPLRNFIPLPLSSLSLLILQLLETFSSGVSVGEGEAEATLAAAARTADGETQHDTAIYWFSCTHKRQVRVLLERRLVTVAGRGAGAVPEKAFAGSGVCWMRGARCRAKMVYLQSHQMNV